MNITRIIDARISHYRDNGQTIAYITWVDQREKAGTTSGDPRNPHMAALLSRAKRDGVEIGGLN